MKKIWCLMLAVSLVFLMTACQQEEMIQKETEQETPAEIQENTPEETKPPKQKNDLSWTKGIDPVQEISGTVEGTTETYVRELTDPKYQGRVGGSEGNRAAADYLAKEFGRIGLQQLPQLGSWKQSYQTNIASILPGEAWIVAPDQTQTALELGKDWVFRASPEELDVTLSLTADQAVYNEGKAIWDANVESKGTARKLNLTTGEVSAGMAYTNPSGNPSRILVSEEVYAQLKQPGYQIHLRLPDAIDEEGFAENVVGYLPGKDRTKAVVLGANFDGPGQCGPLLMSGAYNNASGVATMIQTAEWLVQSDELPCDVIFAAFNTEDNTENGSGALSKLIEDQYEQIRMVNIKCIGWKGQPLTIYGNNSEAVLRNSLAGGLELQYADRDLGADEKAFYGEKMSAVLLFQDACLTNPEIMSVLNTTRDTADNLDFAMLDDIAKKLAAWVIERGDEPLDSYVVYW